MTTLDDDSIGTRDSTQEEPPNENTPLRLTQAGSALTGVGLTGGGLGLVWTGSPLMWLVVGGAVTLILGLTVLLAVALLSRREAPAARLERLIRAVKHP
jgi:hypothetical protein